MHRGQLCTGRLFNCTPAQLPPDVKANLTTLLRRGGTDLEGFIRPGCTHLTVDVVLNAEEVAAVRALQLPVYASLLRYGDPARTARNAAAAHAEGYGAVKLHEIDPAAVLAARDALGPDAVLMDDVNCPWSVAEALEHERLLRPAALHWLEEPVWPPEDAAGLARVPRCRHADRRRGELCDGACLRRPVRRRVGGRGATERRQDRHHRGTPGDRAGGCGQCARRAALRLFRAGLSRLVALGRNARDPAAGAPVADAGGKPVRSLAGRAGWGGGCAHRPRPGLRPGRGDPGTLPPRPRRRGKGGRMKITALHTTPGELTLPSPAVGGLGPIKTIGLVATRIETDEGLFGEHVLITLHGRHVRVLDEMVQSLAPLVVGRDPLHSTAIWADGWRQNNFVGHKGVAVMGLSAVDGALWDIRGKAAGLNIAALIGQARTAVPTYASGGLWLDRSIDALQAEASGFVSAGFRAVKMRLAPGPLPATEARVRAVREAIGPGITLMADANQQLNEAEAIRMGRMLERYDLAWFEEPLPAWDLAGVARVAAALDTPIASGETEYARYGFRTMLELRSADVLMPDLQRVGGVTEFIRVANFAAAYDVPVSSHLFPEMSLSVLAGLENATWLEHMPWLSPLYNEAVELQDGAAVVPDRPGWGFTLNMKNWLGRPTG